MSDTSAPVADKPRRKALSPEEQLERMERDIELVRSRIRENRQKAAALLGEALLAEASEKPELMTLLQDVAGRKVPTKSGLAAVRTLLAKR